MPKPPTRPEPSPALSRANDPLTRLKEVLLAMAYLFACLGAAWWAGYDQPSSVKMAFLVFAFVFFFFGYLSYFYHMANFSQAESLHEWEQMKQPAPPLWRMLLYVGMGLFWAGVLLWLLLWRASS